MPEQVLVKPNSLYEDANKLRTETTEALAQKPPVKSGSGYMANKLDEMVQNMKELHAKAIELVNASSTMLEKMGFEFEEMDNTSAGIYNNIK